MSDFFKSGKTLCQEGEDLLHSGDALGAFEKYKAAAKKKYALGAYNCALLIFGGFKGGEICAEAEYPEEEREHDAYEYIEEAAELGHAESMVVLGEYLNGTFGNEKQDLEQAFRWFLRAEKAGFQQAIEYVAYCYHVGAGVKKDEKTALKYYQKGAALNDGGCVVEYASFLQEGKFIKQDCEKAFELFQSAAKGDSRAAERRVGDCYEKGLGTRVDYLKATEWYLLSGDKGNQYAKKAYDELLKKIGNFETEKGATCAFLAVCHSRGIHGYERKLDKAIEYIYSALKERFPDEPKEPEGIKEYNEDTMKLFEKACKRESDGRNYASAIKAYLKAARTGHRDAPGRALRLAEKTGITEDSEELHTLARRYGDPYLMQDTPRIIELVKRGEPEALEYVRELKGMTPADPLYRAVETVTAFICAERLRTAPTPEAAMMALKYQAYLDDGQIPQGTYDLARQNGLYLYSVSEYVQALRCGVAKAAGMITYEEKLAAEKARKEAEEEAQFDSYYREKLLRQLASLEVRELAEHIEFEERLANVHNIGEDLTAAEAMSLGKADVFDYMAYKREKETRLNRESDKQYEKLKIKYLGKTNEQLEAILREKQEANGNL